jgi:hypothetical protein
VLDTFFAAGRPALPPAPENSTLITDPMARASPGHRRSRSLMFERRLYTISTGRYHGDPRSARSGPRPLQRDLHQPEAPHRFVIQLYAIVIGLFAIVVMLSVDYRAFTEVAPHFRRDPGGVDLRAPVRSRG